MQIPRLSVTLGYFLDGPSFPGPLGIPAAVSSASPAPDATIESRVAGPLTFLTDLENWLGFPEFSPLEGIRTAQCCKACRSLCSGKEKPFYAKSFGTAPWTVASRLKTVLDGLQLSGWKGEHPDGEEGHRLRDLAALAAAIGELSSNSAPGLPDRLDSVIEALAHPGIPCTVTVTLLEPEALWPASWRRLFSALREYAGAEISDAPDPRDFDPSEGSNLARFQRVLASRHGRDAAEANPDDDSLVILTAETADLASETVARLLPAEAQKGSAVLLRSTESLTLEESLNRFHQPASGLSPLSPARGVMQILPLALRMRWQPRSMQTLLDFLLLPSNPLPQKLSLKLASVIAKKPGIDPSGWREDEKMTPILTDLFGQKAEDGWAEALSWIAPKELAGSKGMATSIIRDVCEKITAWAGKQAAQSKSYKAALSRMLDKMAALEPSDTAGLQKLTAKADLLKAHAAKADLLKTLAAASRELQEMVLESGETEFQAPVLETMLDEVTGRGAPHAFSAPEASPWTCVRHPGQIHDACGTLVWWLFTDPPRPETFFWSKGEENFLRKRGMMPESSRDLQNLYFRAARRALLSCRKAILVLPRRLEGEPTAPHPFLDFMELAFGKSDALSALSRECANFAIHDGFEAARVSPLPVPCENPCLETETPPAVPDSISVTNAENALDCPFRGLLASHGLAGSGVKLTMFPNEKILLGTVSHLLVEEMLKDKNQPAEPEAARDFMEKLLESSLPKRAAFLLEPGRETDRAFFAERMKCVAARLAEKMGHLTEPEIEKELGMDIKGDAWKTRLHGYADVVLTQSEGPSEKASAKIVWDLKWSQSSRFRKKLAQDKAFQLAAYAAMEARSTGKDKRVSAAYWLLPPNMLMEEEPEKFAAMWETLEKQLSETISEWTEGNVSVAERKNAEAAGCGWCSLNLVCGRRYAGIL